MRTSERILQKSQANVDAENYSPQVQNLVAEWEHDHAMARERDVTGREPANRPIKVASERSGNAHSKQLIRVRIKSVDIPF